MLSVSCSGPFRLSSIKLHQVKMVSQSKHCSLCCHTHKGSSDVMSVEGWGGVGASGLSLCPTLHPPPTHTHTRHECRSHDCLFLPYNHTHLPISGSCLLHADQSELSVCASDPLSDAASGCGCGTLVFVVSTNSSVRSVVMELD